MAQESGGSGTDYLGLLGSGGGLIGGLTSFYQPFISQNWARNASREAWHRQKWMMVNQYSLQMKGLRKAGLNPLLAYTQGPGSGNVTPSQYASFDSDGDVVGRAVSSAKAAGSVRSQLSMIRDQARITSEQAKQEALRTIQENENVFINQANSVKAAAEAKSAEAQRDIMNATKDSVIGLKKNELERMRTQLELQRSQLPSAKAQAEFDSSSAGQTLIYLRRAVDVVRP